MIDYLMELGAKLVVDEDNYCRAMYLAVANGHLHTVKHLESLGVSLHFSKEKSLVMKSLSNNHEDIFYYLKEKGLEILVKNKENKSTLMKAAQNNMFDIVALLIKEGAMPLNKNNKGFTAFQLAAIKDYKETIKVFIENDVKIYKLNDEEMLQVMKLMDNNIEFFGKDFVEKAMSDSFVKAVNKKKNLSVKYMIN